MVAVFVGVGESSECLLAFFVEYVFAPLPRIWWHILRAAVHRSAVQLASDRSKQRVHYADHERRAASSRGGVRVGWIGFSYLFILCV